MPKQRKLQTIKMDGNEYLRAQIEKALQSSKLTDSHTVEILLERPKASEHGDLATNVAMNLASKLRRNPREIAGELLDKLQLDSEIVASAEIAGGGFINFRFTYDYYRQALPSILDVGTQFGRSEWGNRKKVQIEFVSANPTGPLNIVSARAAAVGDVLASLFNAVGFDCAREYYVNDAGRQVRLLGRSLSARYMELLGKKVAFPEEGYHGDYIREMAQDLIDEHGDEFTKLSIEERCERFSEIGLAKIIASQKVVLKSYGVNYDRWFHESSLRSSNGHHGVLKRFADKDLLYEKDGAKWFKAAEFGDEKDRVLVTSEGEPTYFLVDIAYHLNKYQRGFEMLYDLWGPDHHGYIDRVKAALVALGYPKGSFDVKIIQQVNLLRGGTAVKMSKRAGEIIEMAELIEEVGVDVARFFFLERRTQSPLDFDLDLAKNTSDENPVYYVQYAHARICNILKYAEEQGTGFTSKADLSPLREPEEIDLMKKLLEFPEIVTLAAKFLEPHRIPNYLRELATTFHRFYHHHRVVTEDRTLTQARLTLVECTRIVLANALDLMGISAPECM
ncbi:arginine--tRNA ligase [bacterium]|nr:arginine--tRNA ligase [bacterium]